MSNLLRRALDSAEPPKRAANKVIKLGAEFARSHGLQDEPAQAVVWAKRVPAYGRVVPNPRAQAEAHANAYHAALEQRDWDTALTELREAVKLDRARLAPFPIEKFQPLAEFNARMEKMIKELKAVPLAQGHDEIFYPGEIEARNEVKNRSEGLLLPDDTLGDLAKVGRETGVRLTF